MTIEKIDWQGVSCVWYERGNSMDNSKHTPKRQHFDADALMPYQRLFKTAHLQLQDLKAS